MAVVNTRFAADLLPQGAPAGCDRMHAWTTEDYEETYALGGGGFGCVVMARHRATGEMVAVKKFHSSTTDDSTDDDVLREASFLLACEGHSSIVQLRAISFDLSRAAGKNLSLVMECVGPSLHDVLQKIRRGNPFHEDTVRIMMGQLLGAAKHMHERLIVHRDIEPQNILVDKSIVKICDLGLAVRMSDTPPYSKVGTRRYMAPEMLLGKDDYDAMVDMWSLGCVMAELLLGKPMFDGEDKEELLSSIHGVLRVPYIDNWAEYCSLPPSEKLVKPPRIRHRSVLHEHFPEDRLSKEGLDVLRGLLLCNFNKRLSAAATLRHPWFN